VDGSKHSNLLPLQPTHPLSPYRAEFPNILPVTTNHAHLAVYWVDEDICLGAYTSVCGYRIGANYMAKISDMHPVRQSSICIGQWNKNCVMVSLSTSVF